MNFVPPSANHLSRLYHELSRLGARAVGERREWPYGKPDKHALIVLAADMSRYDPRLFGILVEYLADHWTELNPFELRRALKGAKCPQALLASFEFVAREFETPEARYCADYLARGFAPLAPQLYFLDLHAPGSRLMRLAAEESLEEFRKWGFLARERPVLHREGLRSEIGHWGPAVRRNVIDRLLARQGTVTLSGYLRALGHSVSRQQALVDLKSHPGLRLNGRGRGSVWRAARRRG